MTNHDAKRIALMVVIFSGVPLTPNRARAGEPNGEFRMFWVPGGENPTDYSSGPTVLYTKILRGQAIDIDIYVEQVPGQYARGVQLAFPCASAGGSSGSVKYRTGTWEGNIDFCLNDTCPGGTGAVAEPQCLNFPIGNEDCSPNFSFWLALASTVVAICEPKLVASVELEVSADASGVHAFEFDAGNTAVLGRDSEPVAGLKLEPLVLNFDDCQTNEHCHDADRCTFDRCVAESCANEPALFGDVAGSQGVCGPDGRLDIFDLFAVFDAFMGRYADGCEPHNLDLAGRKGLCTPDGRIDINDIFAVLDATGDPDQCCSTDDD